MISTDADLGIAAAVASELLGANVETVERVFNNGRNSRIYRVESATQTFALKQYPVTQGDPRDRLQAEAEALRLMERYSIENVPRLVGMNRQRGFALLTWLEGEPVYAVSIQDIDAAARFLTQIHLLRQKPEAQFFPSAAEACLSGAEIERQIRVRLTHLSQRCGSETDLMTFLDHLFIPALERVLADALSRSSTIGRVYCTVLPDNLRSLIPADFGFHNCLRRADGSLGFLDFEYFGWDDPVKLTADFLLHPGMTLGLDAQRRFRVAAERLYGQDSHFLDRLDAFYPLFGLRWVLVLLNEFLPERWLVREHATGAKHANWAEMKMHQLSKARTFLNRISNEIEEPH